MDLGWWIPCKNCEESFAVSRPPKEKHFYKCPECLMLGLYHPADFSLGLGAPPLSPN